MVVCGCFVDILLFFVEIIPNYKNFTKFTRSPQIQFWMICFLSNSAFLFVSWKTFLENLNNVSVFEWDSSLSWNWLGRQWCTIINLHLSAHKNSVVFVYLSYLTLFQWISLDISRRIYTMVHQFGHPDFVLKLMKNLIHSLIFSGVWKVMDLGYQKIPCQSIQVKASTLERYLWDIFSGKKVLLKPNILGELGGTSNGIRLIVKFQYIQIGIF